MHKVERLVETKEASKRLAEIGETSKDWQRPRRLAETGRDQGD